MSMEYIEKNWREITSRNPISGDQFSTGLKDFKFSVGSGYGFIPNQSYFTVELKITFGNTKPVNDDGLAFAEGCVGNMFNNIYFNIGGQTVSSLTTGVGQCEVLKNRLTKSKAYNDSIGQTTGFIPHFSERLQILCSDSYVGSSGQEDAKFNNGRNKKMFMWKPALGIFDVSTPLGAGEYDIQLNPNVDFVKSAVESTSIVGNLPVGTAGGQVYVEVINMKFYACMVRTNLPSSGVETLHLMEMSVHTANLTGTEVNEEMSVPSSTRAISCFLQDQRAGKNTLYPPSRFTVQDNDQISLRNYQIQYANTTKPTVRYNSEHTDNVDLQQQRYINCALESGQYFNPAGFESYEQFLERGIFIHESFMKASDNLATRVHLTAQYDENNYDSRMYLVAHYSNTVQITRTNGMISDVKILSI